MLGCFCVAVRYFGPYLSGSSMYWAALYVLGFIDVVLWYIGLPLCGYTLLLLLGISSVGVSFLVGLPARAVATGWWDLHCSSGTVCLRSVLLSSIICFFMFV